MIFQNKKTKALVETICSGAGWICFVELGKDQEYNSSAGKVFKGSKRDFKKIFQKASPKTIKKVGVFELPDQLKEEVSEQIQNDIHFILNDLETYIEMRGDNLPLEEESDIIDVEAIPIEEESKDV